MKKTLFTALICALLTLTACAPQAEVSSPADTSSQTEQSQSVELLYAKEFAIERCSDNISLITIGGSDRFVIADKGTEIPSEYGNSAVIYRPVENIYSAASSTMDFFHELDSIDSVTMTSTKESDWSLDYMQELFGSGKISYVGKYNAPDFEYIASANCGMVLESQMITHSPEIKEQLEALGIPVLVERSSYEEHPLGRLEWIKLYGELLGKQELAERIFSEKNSMVTEILTDERTEKTAAFFYISTSGSVNVRKPGDYISKMIELAGGNYIFTSEDLSVDENALSTMNIQMETFYAKAKDADFLIYNGTIGELRTLDDLIAKDALFADFKAVREGNVWCSGKNMYQQITSTADVISDFHKIFTGNAKDGEELTYLYRLK
ncbi:MAG: ABC transporter substrate-binding protein [Oscillospiraceae bacterium]